MPSSWRQEARETVHAPERETPYDAPGAAKAGDNAETGSAAGPPSEPDYYGVLGVAPDASDEEIRTTFRRLAMLWHPDHYTNAPKALRERAERRMRALIRAHSVLSNPARRRQYDRTRAGEEAHSGISPRGTSPDHTAHSNPISVHHEYVPASEGNPNAAGWLFGVLALVLAIAVLGHLIRYGVDSGMGTILGVGLLVALVVVAGFLVTDDSPLARAARDYMEREPAYARRAPIKHGAKGQHAAHAGEPEPTAFEKLVDEALASVPPEFQGYLENVVVRVKEEPSPQEIRDMKLRPCSLLLGLYQGVPLTHQSIYGNGPEVVTIFQRSIEAYCHGDPERIRRQVRATVLHELAHHFGMDHDAMPAWLK
jgi:predicted Zn-dependent protease with MMP-like domain/curved DNA-binding protein CbpA